MNNEAAMNSIFFMGFNLDLNLEKMLEKGAFCLFFQLDTRWCQISLILGYF